jgi:hypothetical protein
MYDRVRTVPAGVYTTSCNVNELLILHKTFVYISCDSDNAALFVVFVRDAVCVSACLRYKLDSIYHLNELQLKRVKTNTL